MAHLLSIGNYSRNLNLHHPKVIFCPPLPASVPFVVREVLVRPLRMTRSESRNLPRPEGNKKEMRRRILRRALRILTLEI
jgi:hypothetical protein